MRPTALELAVAALEKARAEAVEADNTKKALVEERAAFNDEVQKFAQIRYGISIQRSVTDCA